MSTDGTGSIFRSSLPSSLEDMAYVGLGAGISLTLFIISTISLYADVNTVMYADVNTSRDVMQYHLRLDGWHPVCIPGELDLASSFSQSRMHVLQVPVRCARTATYGQDEHHEVWNELFRLRRHRNVRFIN